MKYRILFLTFFSFLLLPLTLPAKAPNWGKTGHRATAEIATKYLTDHAKEQIHEILGGDGMALVSTYGDDIKSDHEYDRYAIWHFVNIPEGKTYADIKDDLGPNIISALQEAKEKLLNKSTSVEEKQFYLKMFIHLIGDLHQPLHVGRPEDRGGNDIIVFWFGEPSNLHKIWDSDMLDHFQMSYTELAANEGRLTTEERQEIEQGGLEDWLGESVKIADKIYASTRNGDYLGFDYAYDWTDVVRQQLQKGGIRLAKELNAIFK